MDSTSTFPADNERLAQLQAQIRNHKPVPQFYNYACQLFNAIGSIAQIYRYYKDWSWEEAPLWLNLAFWGGYLAVIFVFGPIIAWGIIKNWRMGKVLKEFEMEMRRRGLEPYREGAEKSGGQGIAVEDSEMRYTDEKLAVEEIEVADAMDGFKELA
jgi:hypothetical protein